MIDPNPCKDCTERYTACHDHCEKREKWLVQYHGQQKHLKDNQGRFCIPRSAARDKNSVFYTNHPVKGRKGGEQ